MLPLCKILKLSFEQGTFPDLMEIARVTPIYKKGDRQLRSNHRPVSILPLFSVRILDYIKKSNILYRGQFGFREKCSTQDVLLI